MKVEPNQHDVETIRVLERAELHIGGGCECPGRMSDGPSSPECIQALELACRAAQDEVLTTLANARHEIWVTSMLFAQRDALEKLELRIAALDGSAT